MDIFGEFEADRGGDISKRRIEGEAFQGVIPLFEPIDAEHVSSVPVGEGERRQPPVEAQIDDCLRMEFLDEPDGERLMSFPGAFDRFDKMKSAVSARVEPFAKRQRNCNRGQFPSKRKEQFTPFFLFWQSRVHSRFLGSKKITTEGLGRKTKEKTEKIIGSRERGIRGCFFAESE